MMEISRSQLLDMLWEKAEPLAFFPKEQFIDALADWEIYPALKNDKVIAILTEKGPELHFETMHTGLGFPRKDLFAIVQRMIDRYGYATTKTPKHELRQHKFNQILGFEVVGEDEYDIHFRIDKIRSSRRGAQCQS